MSLIDRLLMNNHLDNEGNINLEKAKAITVGDISKQWGYAKGNFFYEE